MVWSRRLLLALAVVALACAAARAADAPAATSPSASTAAGAAAVCPPAIADAPSKPPRDRGLLWRLARDGRHSYLFGSVHVGRPEWRRFGPRTLEALAASDVLALELDPTDAATLAAIVEPQPASDWPATVQQRLRQAAVRACLPPLALATLHPVLQATTLALLDARWLGLDAGFALEVLLARHARDAGRRIVALETAIEQRQALVPDDPGDMVALVEHSLDQIDGRVTRRVLARLVDAWEAGDLAVLERYESWCECADSDADRAYVRRLNDARNPALAARIDALHAEGHRVFAAVGALHMTGARALQRLLAERGFRVERVEFGR